MIRHARFHLLGTSSWASPHQSVHAGDSRGPRTERRLRGWLAVALLLIIAAPASGQQLELKTALHPNAEEFCGRIEAPLADGPATQAAVDSLLAAGSQAAILGDHYRAGELLREAATLAPANPVVAYRLARTYEERGEPELALSEYCRYMVISPQAPDSGEVRERISQLASSTSEVDREELEAAVRAGIEAYEAQRFSAAALAFDRVIQMRPEWAAGYFNRGLANLGLGRAEVAVADLEYYLGLAPSADDRALVQARIDSLRVSPGTEPVVARRSPAPGGALALGLVVPGMGQLYSGRPLAAGLVLGGAAAALVWAFQEDEVTRTRSAVDPFGNPYEYDVRVRERTHLVPGIGAAAAIAVIGAVEAFAVARGRAAAIQVGNAAGIRGHIHPHVGRSGYGVAVELRRPAPHSPKPAALLR